MNNSELEEVKAINTFAHSGTRMSRNPCVWRYMDLLSLLCLLQNKELHFAHLRDLQKIDHNEGTGGLLIDVVNNPIKPSIYIYPPNPDIELRNKEEIQKIEAELKIPLSEKLSEYKKQVKDWDRENANVYISCWHTNPIDSDFMWKLYAKYEYGFAIVSSAHDVVNSLLVDGIEPAKIGWGFIVYPTRDELMRDRLNEHCGSAAAFMIKHPSFSQENEFRVFVKTRALVDSCDMKVDINKLIHEIRLSPLVPDWAYDPLYKTLNPICEEHSITLIKPTRINLRT